MAKKGVVRSRFGGFAVGHFCVSAVGLALIINLFPLAPMGLDRFWPLLGLMLLYLPAGCLTARACGWSRPNAYVGICSVLLPALCAWAFALAGWALLCSGGEGLTGAGFFMLLSTAVLASPSFCLMLLALEPMIELPVFTWGPLWYAAMFLAGLLPPLLFLIGSLLTGKALDNGPNRDTIPE